MPGPIDPRADLLGQIAQKATSIGPRPPGTTTLPLTTGMENQQPDVLARIIAFLGDPVTNSGLGGMGMGGMMRGMVGGLPFGLNPEAIRQLMRRTSAPAPAVEGALGPTTKALKDVIERRVTPGKPPAGVSERRYDELMKKFKFGEYWKP